MAHVDRREANRALRGFTLGVALGFALMITTRWRARPDEVFGRMPSA